MVLEIASDPPIAIDSTAPSSDNDPYTSSEPSSTSTFGSVHIDTSKLPKPMPVFGPLLGYNENFFSTALQHKLRRFLEDLKRPTTQDEADAVAFHTAKQISIMSYGAPLGAAGGLWRAYSTLGTFRFPFYQPNMETFNTSIFPHTRLPFLGGGRAVLAWHAARALFYGYFGSWFGGAIFSGYAASVGLVGQLADPRLKDAMSEMQQNVRRKRGQLPDPTTKQPGFGQNVDTNAQKDSQQDASPTTAYYEVNGKDSYGNNIQNGQWPGSESPPPPVKAGQWPKRPAPVQNQPQEESSPPFDAWDDASPTGGQGVVVDIKAPEPQKGSAWERIRRGEGPTKRGPPVSGNDTWSKVRKEVQNEQHQGSTTGDSFAFSKSEEEQVLPKEEAQKEFDARVERERRGGDFSSGSGDQKRW